MHPSVVALWAGLLRSYSVPYPNSTLYQSLVEHFIRGNFVTCHFSSVMIEKEGHMSLSLEPLFLHFVARAALKVASKPLFTMYVMFTCSYVHMVCSHVC